MTSPPSSGQAPREYGIPSWEATRIACMVAQLPAVIADSQQPALIRQAALDSFFMAVRTLVEYLGLRPDKRDRPASDAAPSWSLTPDAARDGRLHQAWHDASKHFMHFSMVRHQPVAKSTAEIDRLADDIFDVWDDLVKNSQGVFNLNRGHLVSLNYEAHWGA